MPRTILHPDSPSLSTQARSAIWQILVVDDSLTVLNVIAAILRRESRLTVTLEQSPFRAEQLVADRPDAFDLILTDYRMPGMNGETLARHLKLIREDLPILSVTTTPDATRDNPDFTATLTKPFSPGELLHEVVYQCHVAGRLTPDQDHSQNNQSKVAEITNLHATSP